LLPPADIYLVFPSKSNMSAKTRVFVDFMLAKFEVHRNSLAGGGDW